MMLAVAIVLMVTIWAAACAYGLRMACKDQKQKSNPNFNGLAYWGFDNQRDEDKRRAAASSGCPRMPYAIK